MERKEAIDVVKKNWPDSSFTRLREALETLIPELKESEDERIRKSLINYVYCHGDAGDFTKKEFIAWLEKQGKNNMGISEATKKKLEDNLTQALGKETPESWNKFLDEQGEQNQKHFELKAGHWYICHRAYCCRADHLTVKEGERFMCEKDGVVKGFIVKEPEKYFKEVCAPAPMEGEQKPTEWSEKIKGLDELETYILSIVPNRPLDAIKVDSKNIRFLINKEQKPWSEEDKIQLDSAIHLVSNTGHFNTANWLKSLKDRTQSKTTWRPSDKQIIALRWVLNNVPYNKHKEEISGLLDQIKDL